MLFCAWNLAKTSHQRKIFSCLHEYNRVQKIKNLSSLWDQINSHNDPLYFSLSSTYCEKFPQKL